MIAEYQQKETYIHSLHPAVQLLMIFSLASISLATDNPIMQISVVCACLLIAIAADVLGEWLSWWKLCALIGLVAIIVNPLISRQGSTIIWRGPALPVFGRLDITLEALMYGFGMALKLSTLVLCFALVSLIVDPDRILGRLRGRGSRSALLSALTLKMIPTSTRDANEILDAQRSRGIAKDSGGKYEVLKSRLPLISKLVSTGLDRAVGLAEAMESRAYGSGTRTRYQEYRMKSGDYLILWSAIILTTITIAGLILELCPFSYYPKLTWSLSGWDLVLFLIPVVFSLVVLLFSRSWKRWIWLRSRV